MNTNRRFKNSVQNHFSFLKKTDAVDALYVKSLKIKNNRGYLLPVCKLHIEDTDFCKNLTSILFTKGEGSATNWINENVLSNDSKMLFAVANQLGKITGYIDLSIDDENLDKSCVVIQSVVPSSAELEILALECCLTWVNEKILPDDVFVSINREYSTKDQDNLNLKRIDTLPKFNKINLDPQKLYYKYSSLKADFSPSKMILTAGPSISSLEAYYAYDATLNGWNSRWSEYLKTFEKKFADYIGVKYAIATSSCTGALHLALTSLGIKPGDEVIVPDITWVATGNAVSYTGATPIFCDIDRDTWCIDVKSIEKLITPKTKAIVPVHLYGHAANMDEVMRIAKANNLFVVEDAAPAIGTTIGEKKVGSYGDFSAFSFQGAKLTVTGEGGMLLTDDKNLYDKAYSLWDQGRDLSRTFWINEMGWKYKMSNVQAAIGLGQLERVEDLIHAKRKIFGWYSERLKDLKSIKLCYEPTNTRSIYWMSSIQVLSHAKLNRDQLSAQLKLRNIDTRPVFPSISQYPVWKTERTPQPVALEIGNSSLNLPSGVCLQESEVDYVCRMIKDLLS